MVRWIDPCWSWGLPLVFCFVPQRPTQPNSNTPPTHSICYDIFYGTRKPAVMYLPCLFYPKNNAKVGSLMVIWVGMDVRLLWYLIWICMWMLMSVNLSGRQSAYMVLCAKKDDDGSIQISRLTHRLQISTPTYKPTTRRPTSRTGASATRTPSSAPTTTAWPAPPVKKSVLFYFWIGIFFVCVCLCVPMCVCVCKEAEIHTRDGPLSRFAFNSPTPHPITPHHHTMKGDFAAGTVSRWTADTIFLIERLITKSPVILVGSGVGGWISLLVASKRPDLVVSLDIRGVVCI